MGARLLLPVGRAEWAIAAGCLGLLIFPGPIAVLCSILAMREIKKSANTPYPNHGMGRVAVGFMGGLLHTELRSKTNARG